ncbi:MAG: hypothetical protein ACI89X_004951 [Planctomycetota bacterium]|jgi:hypothetical protein
MQAGRLLDLQVTSAAGLGSSLEAAYSNLPSLRLKMLPIGSFVNTILVASPPVDQTTQHQVVSLELGAPSAFASVSSTQGISATIDSLW